MLGTVTGDIAGSVHGFANRRTKSFGPLFHEKSRFTDDTLCTVAVADALVRGRDPDRALQDWGRRYWDNGGWGQRFVNTLAAVAGSVAEARLGMPDDIAHAVWARPPQDMRQVLKALHALHGQRSGVPEAAVQVGRD